MDDLAQWDMALMCRSKVATYRTLYPIIKPTPKGKVPNDNECNRNRRSPDTSCRSL